MRFVALSGALVVTLVLATAAQTHSAPSYPHGYAMTTKTVGKWAVVLGRIAVRARPNARSRLVTMLKPVTYDDTQNLVLIISGVDTNANHTWYRVRLPIRPNNSTGWVQATALGDINTVHSHLYVNRERETITLQRNGHRIFRAPVTVGEPMNPTPRGEFYVVDYFPHTHSPAYGPTGFGTSARAPNLSDWPGGGMVGIHGTDEPAGVPGAISHGGIRLRNPDMLRLAKLLPVGTPLTIR